MKLSKSSRRTILAVLAVFAISLQPFSRAHAAPETGLEDKTAPKKTSAEAAPVTAAQQTEASEFPDEPSYPTGSDALMQKQSKMRPAELPPAIQQLLEAPVRGFEGAEKRVALTGRPQVLLEPERAGFERYYNEGRGFKINDYLSLSGRVELVEDFIPIDSLILASNEQRIRGLNNLELEDSLTDDEIRTSYTRAEAGTAILKFRDDLPLLRFTYDYRQVYRAFDDELIAFKELRQTSYENFIEYRIPYKLPVLGDWTVNAGYSRILVRTPGNSSGNELRNKWTFINAFQIDKEREMVFQYEYFHGKHVDAPFILKPDQHFFLVQWRQRFPDWRLYSVTNYSATRLAFKPDVALFTKHEVFQEFNKDLLPHLRASNRTTFLYDKVANSNFNPDKVYATAFVNRLKISYEFIPSIDESFIYQQSWGLSTAEFDNSLFALETEIFKPGLLRTSVGYFIQRYYNSSKTVNGIQFRAFVFQ